MSDERTSVYVDMKFLLPKKEIRLQAVMSGTLDDAVQELRSNDPDYNMINYYLSPGLVLTIPNVCNALPVNTNHKWIYMSLRPHMLTRMVRYLEAMDIMYRIGED